MTVLELFTPRVREIGVVEAATRLGAGKGTVSRWMSAMQEAGFLDRDPVSQRYRLSTRLAVLGELARDASSLQRLAGAELQWLATTTGETATLTVPLGAQVMNVAAVESPRPIMHTGWIGRRLPSYATASGKAILAWRDPAEVRDLIGGALTRLTANTITDMDELAKELAEVRANGYSMAWGEFEEDLAGIGAPVRDHTGAVVGALSIGAPISRVPAERLGEIREAVMGAARSLSSQLGYHTGVD